MSNTQVLEWQNSNGLTEYPLTQKFFLTNLLVDAQFQQFDNFVPVLNSVAITTNELIFNITYDQGMQGFGFLQSQYNSGINYLRLNVGSRYIGRLILGPGVNVLWTNYVGQTVDVNSPFATTTVKSISSSLGVYSLNNSFGHITFSPGDLAVFFDTGNNFVTFNAVLNHKLLTNPPAPALKLLNLVGPTNNNIYIADSDVLKIQPGPSSLNFNLIGSLPGTNNPKLVNTVNF